MSKPIVRLGAAASVLALATLSVPRHAAPAPSPQEPGAPAGVRGVRFAIDPPGAQLAIDGRVVPWFGRTIPLGLGPHSVTAEVPASRCCEALSTTITVAPTRNGAQQTFALRLKPRPAQVVLVDAPSDATLVCPTLGLAAGAGRLVEVAMSRVVWSGRCELARLGEPPRQEAVTLVAGEIAAVRW
jgi:hypothetical protein